MQSALLNFVLRRRTVAAAKHQPLFEALCVRGFAEDTRSEPTAGAPAEEVSDPARVQSGLQTSTSQPSQPARRKGRRLTRKEKGSWVNDQGLAEEASKNAPVWPANQPFYDVQGQAPWLLDATNPVFAGFQQLQRERPDLFEALHSKPTEDEPPRPGARKILQWEMNVVFDKDPVGGEVHPLNKKVKCRVYLRDLQREHDLSDKALQRIALISGPRYNPADGVLTLTSERTPDREENRLHIVEILQKLVREGQQAHPKQRDAAVAA